MGNRGDLTLFLVCLALLLVAIYQYRQQRIVKPLRDRVKALPDLGRPCSHCGGRLASKAHYVGGGRVVGPCCVALFEQEVNHG